MKEIDFWKFIFEKTTSGYTLIFMIVADSSKSSPGRQGFKMAVSSDGELAGTIGGGIMEHNLVEKCREYLHNGKDINTVKKLFHNTSSEGEKSGLICGGTETIIMKTLTSDNNKFVSDVISSFDNLEGGTLLVTNSQLTFEVTKSRERGILFNYNSDNDWVYKENTGFPDTVYIIGSGHVGLAVSRIMSMLDFYVITMDSREDVSTVINNTYADKKLVVQYHDVGNYIIESDKSYVVIVTHGHDTDLSVIQGMITRKLAYLGMMGSKRKIKSIFEHLKNNGIDPELLSKVHAPIGLEIDAETPDEIAVSIAAEIIKIKNESALQNRD